MDTLSTEQRSERMRRVRSKNTKPEMIVRRLVYAMGYRYRLHDSQLPGTPDMVFKGRRKVIEIRGCTWHGHEGCGRVPKSRQDFWLRKINSNQDRDSANEAKLRDLGWQLLVIWECELKVRDRERLTSRIRMFLDESASDVTNKNLAGEDSVN